MLNLGRLKPAYDALLIGAGHNGLVCACYLAKAGLKVRLLERRSVAGGAAVTEEFLPGFRNSVASYTVSLLQPKIIQDLHLYEHGLRILERPLANFLPLNEANHLKLGGGLNAIQAEFARFSERDAEQLPEYYVMLDGVAGVLRSLLLRTPPNISGGWSNLIRAIQQSASLRKLSMPQRRDLLDIFTISAAELLERWFESEPIKAVFGFDSVVGNFASPYAAGTAYVLLHHVFGEVNGKQGQWGHAVGGMGAITQAMAAEAQTLGAEISLDSGVERVVVEKGRATGVQLASGEVITAQRIIANINPKLLYQKLFDPSDLPPELLERISHYRCGSASFRMNIALSELPDFSCLPGKHLQAHHQAGILIAPSLDYMDRAYTDARAHGWAYEPIIEMLIPSTVDDSLAPPGQHVASLFCQHFNPQLPNGNNWLDAREQAADAIIDTVTRYAPNFKASVLGRMILSPQDLAEKFGLIGGDIFHGALSLNQLYSARPLLGYADYRGAVKGLYLCGSGTHPGGGVTGAPGHNAAQEILRDMRKQ